MENTKTETLSFRVPADLKTEFLEIFKQSDAQSKPKLFKELLDKYKKETSEKPDANPVTESSPTDILETEIPEEEISEEITVESLEDITADEEEDIPELPVLEISVKLNPVQVFAIRETILNEGFKETVNKLIDKVDNAKDTSLFGNSLYSGAFKGVFSPMDLDETVEESINKNMGVALVNQFMSGIVIGAGDMLTPVTRNMIKEFIKVTEEETKENSL